MNNPGLCKSRINCLTGFDQCAKVLSKRIYDSKLGNEKNIGCLIVNYKTRRRSDTLKGSQRMGEGRIFLKTCRASLFNDDLSNEPNFCWIHLAVPLISRKTVKIKVSLIFFLVDGRVRSWIRIRTDNYGSGRPKNFRIQGTGNKYRCTFLFSIISTGILYCQNILFLSGSTGRLWLGLT
jgi:hypothetical protein